MMRICKRCDIDIDRWNRTVSLSSGANLYAYSWYLDAIDPYWSAFIFDDYEGVMPFFTRKLLWWKACYQPWFLQQSGVFSSSDKLEQYTIEAEIVLQRLFAKGHYSFGEHCITFLQKQHNRRQTQTLPLSAPYQTLFGNYRRNTRRNISFAQENGLSLVLDNNSKEFMRFVSKYLGSDILPRKQVKRANNLTKTLLNNSTAQIYWVLSKDSSKIACGLFAFMNSRIYFLICASSPEGKHKNAMYFLVDRIIQTHASSNYVFDFCGSSLQGVTYFNTGFGTCNNEFSIVSL